MSRRNRSTAYRFLAALAALVGALFQLLAATATLLARCVSWLAGRAHALASRVPSGQKQGAQGLQVTQVPQAVFHAPAPAPRAPQAAPLFQPGPTLPRTLHEIPRLSLVRAAATPSPAATSLLHCLAPQSATPAAPRDEAELAATAKLLLETLHHFGVHGTLSNISTGPAVTTFEISPTPGTKASKVQGLDEDLSLALGRKVRILLPVPGTTKLGFEVSNDAPAHVALRDILADSRFTSSSAALPLALGRDTLGRPVIADLAAMPHVIVAGETGSGKSVGLHVMLLSLLTSRSPADLKLLLIDPKAVELTSYNGLPHMLRPVVTDADKAAEDLAWAVNEMERRYQLFSSAGVKNLASYNKTSSNKLAHVVIMIDEFADLILSNKPIEKLVIRLVQKSRAAGIHMIIATQRPTVNVITGIIKANCPTRIAFRVAQENDSRTILDAQGAENLLGRGDMLLKSGGETKRVQCSWVSENEIAHATSALREQVRAA